MLHILGIAGGGLNPWLRWIIKGVIQRRNQPVSSSTYTPTLPTTPNADPEPFDTLSWLGLTAEDVWREEREASMRRACRIMGIPYKPEYADIGR
jgi:hypothetical protein